MYKRQVTGKFATENIGEVRLAIRTKRSELIERLSGSDSTCLLYTSDAADERSSVDLGGRRIIKKKKPA